MDKSTLNEDDGGSDSDEISQSFICCVCRSLSSLTNHFFFFFLSLIASIFISQYQLYRIALIFFFFFNLKKYKLLYCFVYTLLILIDCQIYFFRNPHVITNTFQKCETNWSINLDCYFFFFLK